jgi:hypothetical protein
MTTGSCLCGDVGWEIDVAPGWMTHCHCSRCRKAHGTAFSTFVGVPARAFRWTRGESGVREFASSDVLTRTFCARCGTKLPVRWRDEFQLPAATLDGALGVRPGKHIFVGSKAPWHEIRDSLPQLAGSGSSDPELESRRHTEPARGVVRGACLCGAVAFECDVPLAAGDITSCHCSRCRKARAAAHASNTFVARSGFRWLRGEEGLRSYRIPEAARFTQAFCGDCGAPQPVVQAALGRVVIPCGAFEDDPGIREARHIFAPSRAAWFEIAGELPQYVEYAPSPAPAAPPATAR